MYRSYPTLILGFHGCSAPVAETLVTKKNTSFEPSRKEYDWLGSGMYFWEGNAERALEYAKERIQRNGLDEKPAVVGAILDLGLCLNLTEKYHLDGVKDSYEYLEALTAQAGEPMPINESCHNNDADQLLRKLDCAVINLHVKNNSEDGVYFDSVRGMFHESGELYQGSNFSKKAHTQISIINPNCIKGYFWPRELTKDFNRV